MSWLFHVRLLKLPFSIFFNSWSRLIHKPSFFPKAGNSSLPLKKKKQSHLEVSIHNKYLVNWNPLLSLFFLSGICLSLLSKIANGFRWKLTYLYGGGEGGLLSKLMGTELPPLLLVPRHLLLSSADMWSHPLLDSMLTPIAGICGPLPQASSRCLHSPASWPSPVSSNLCSPFDVVWASCHSCTQGRYHPRYHPLMPHRKRQEVKELSRCSWILSKLIWSLCQCFPHASYAPLQRPRQYLYLNASSQNLSQAPVIPEGHFSTSSM